MSTVMASIWGNPEYCWCWDTRQPHLVKIVTQGKPKVVLLVGYTETQIKFVGWDKG